jgi:hypothetical protein
MVALDRETAVAHQNGLVKMLLATPKSFRANIGPLIAIIKMYVAIIICKVDWPIANISSTMLSFSCIYDMLPIWDCLHSESVRPNTLLRNVVSRSSFGNNGSFFEKETLNGVLDVYEALSRLDHLAEADRHSIYAEVERTVSFATPSVLMDTANYHDDPNLTPLQRVNLCCQLSCQIFWKLLCRQSYLEQTPDATENIETQQLLKHLPQIDPLYWIRVAPETLTWVAFTGAATSNNRSECVAFISHAGTILTAAEGEELALTRQGWRYFVLLKRLGGDDNAITVIRDD